MSELGLTKAAFAEMMGVDRAQPTRWAQAGMPTNDDGSVEPVAAAVWVRENVADYARKDRSLGAMQQKEARANQLQRNYDAGMRCAVNVTAHHMLNVAANAAIQIGLTMEQTYALVRDMQTHGGIRRARIMEWLSVPPGDRPPTEPLNNHFVSWRALAASLDVPVDFPAWSAYADRVVGPHPRPDTADGPGPFEEDEEDGEEATSDAAEPEPPKGDLWLGR